MNRKVFLQTVGRASILGGMGALVAIFARERQITLYSDCKDDLKCSSCRSLSRCSLPEALKQREHGKG